MNHDVILKLILDVTNSERDRTDGDFSRAITVLTSGWLVSGYIISEKDFFLHNPDTDVISEGLDELRSKASQFIGGEIGESSVNTRSKIGFIHLQDARFHVAGKCIPDHSYPGVYWRGRLDLVSGFFFGLIQHDV